MYSQKKMNYSQPRGEARVHVRWAKDRPTPHPGRNRDVAHSRHFLCDPFGILVVYSDAFEEAGGRSKVKWVKFQYLIAYGTKQIHSNKGHQAE